MAPILGIYASQISGHLWAPSGAYDSIATTTVGSGGASSITFSSIPSTYTHLQIRIIARTSRAAVADTLTVRVNGDTGSNYNGHYLYGNGSSTFAGAYSSGTLMYLGGTSSATATSGMFGANVIDLLDYTNTNKFKTFRVLEGTDLNDTNGSVFMRSGLWRNTSAITSITLAGDGGNFTQYSSFALYGIKGN